MSQVEKYIIIASSLLAFIISVVCGTIAITSLIVGNQTAFDASITLFGAFGVGFGMILVIYMFGKFLFTV